MTKYEVTKNGKHILYTTNEDEAWIEALHEAIRTVNESPSTLYRIALYRDLYVQIYRKDGSDIRIYVNEVNGNE